MTLPPLGLTNVHADDLRIGVRDADADVDVTSALVRFRDNVLIVTPSGGPAADGTEVVAGRPHEIHAALWTRDPATGTCAVASDYTGAINLYTALDRHGRDPHGEPPQLNGVTLPESGFSPVPARFTAGTAMLTLDTVDVGRFDLRFEDRDSGFAVDEHGQARTLHGGTHRTLVVRPFALGLGNIASSASPAVANPGGTATHGDGFVAAGAQFDLQVTAHLWSAADDADGDGVADADADLSDNGATPAFAGPVTLSVAPNSISPAGGSAGTLGGATTLNGFTQGQATARLTYAQAGSLRLAARRADFLGVAGLDLSGESGTVGRFYPDYFRLESAIFNAACGSGGFTYSGQPFDRLAFTLSARGRDGTLLTNYDAGLGYATGPVDLLAGDASQGLDLSGRWQNLPTAPSWDAGAAGLDTSTAAIARNPTPESAHEAFEVGVAVADPDGADIAGADMHAGFLPGCGVRGDCDARRLGGSALRHGRLVLDGAAGPEHSPLALPLQAEYFTDSGFIANPQDDCTEYDSADTNLMDWTGNLDPGETSAAGSGTLTAGSHDPATPLTLSAPGVNNQGTVRVRLTAPPWLQFNWGDGSHPSAMAVFGVDPGSDVVIRLRERY